MIDFRGPESIILDWGLETNFKGWRDKVSWHKSLKLNKKKKN